jgi:hypothetical protein
VWQQIRRLEIRSNFFCHFLGAFLNLFDLGLGDHPNAVWELAHEDIQSHFNVTGVK